MSQSVNEGEKMCAWKGCKRESDFGLVYHHHEGDPCEIDYKDANHCLFGLCEKHYLKAEDKYAHQFIGCPRDTK
jgi:hypothetical protein